MIHHIRSIVYVLEPRELTARFGKEVKGSTGWSRGTRSLLSGTQQGFLDRGQGFRGACTPVLPRCRPTRRRLRGEPKEAQAAAAPLRKRNVLQCTQLHACMCTYMYVVRRSAEDGSDTSSLSRCHEHHHLDTSAGHIPSRRSPGKTCPCIHLRSSPAPIPLQSRPHGGAAC